MPTINGRACVVNGKAVDKVFSNGKQVYGRNLITGTSSSEKSYTGKGNFSTMFDGVNYPIPPGSRPAVNVGSTYTYSISLTKLTGSFVLGYWGYDSNGNYAIWVLGGTYSSLGKISFTFTIPSGIYYIVPHFAGYSDDFACTVKEEKLELGNKATPWTPAPEDVGVK